MRKGLGEFLFGSLESLLDSENSRTLLDLLHWLSINMQYAALKAFRDLNFGFLRSASSEEEGYELVVCGARHLLFHQGALLLFLILFHLEFKLMGIDYSFMG